jgi:hypothetical protein
MQKGMLYQKAVNVVVSGLDLIIIEKELSFPRFEPDAGLKSNLMVQEKDKTLTPKLSGDRSGVRKSPRAF